MSEKEKLEMLEEMMELGEGDLKPEMKLSEIEEFDSLAKLSLIVLMSDEFSKELTSEQIKGFITIQDIMNCMLKKI